MLWSVVEEMAAFSDAWPRSMLGAIVQDPTNGAGSVGSLHAVEQAHRQASSYLWTAYTTF